MIFVACLGFGFRSNAHLAPKSEVTKRDGILADKGKAIEKALLENKRFYRILNEAGLIVVDSAGNIVSH